MFQRRSTVVSFQIDGSKNNNLFKQIKMNSTSITTWLSSCSEKIILFFQTWKNGTSMNTVLHTSVTTLHIHIIYIHIYNIYNIYIIISTSGGLNCLLPLFPSSKFISFDVIILNSTNVNQVPSSFQVLSLCSISPASLTPFIAKFLSLLHNNTGKKNQNKTKTTHTCWL